MRDTLRSPPPRGRRKGRELSPSSLGWPSRGGERGELSETTLRFELGGRKGKKREDESNLLVFLALVERKKGGEGGRASALQDADFAARGGRRTSRRVIKRKKKEEEWPNSFIEGIKRGEKRK